MTELENKIRALWQAVAQQNEARLARFFTVDAQILWPNTGEQFDLDGYLRVNCGYPGRWSGAVEQVAPDGGFSVARVWSPEGVTARAVSFYQWRNEKIVRMVEYWGDVAPPPAWRRKRE